MSRRPITRGCTVTATSEQLSCEVGDEIVVLGLEDGVYYGLNAVGARIWTLLQEPRTVAEVCRAVLSEYDVESGRCERDVIALVEELAARNLVRVEHERPS